MTSHDTHPEKHDHPFHMNNRGRAIVGTFAVGTLILTGSTIGNAMRSEHTPVKTITEEQLYDSQILDAIEKGPTDTSTIIGEREHAVGQDRTVTNAIIQEAIESGRPVNLKEGSDFLTITLSANTFEDSDEGVSYDPADTFVLFEQDVNNDGKKELLAKISE